MKLIATMPARNEDWIIGLSARAALMWCDGLVVLNHASQDRTMDILLKIKKEFPERVMICEHPDPVWHEMTHRQYLLDVARAHMGATHIAIVDADEVLSGNLLDSIRLEIEKLKEGKMLQLPWACLAQGTGKVYSGGTWGTNWVTTAFHDIPTYGWSTREGYDFHHRHPVGSHSANVKRIGSQGAAGLMHLQFSSRRRLKAKQALYKITEVVRWRQKFTDEQINAKYNPAVYESDPLTTPMIDVPSSWWAPYCHLVQHLDVHANPWQEQAVRDAIAEHGRAKFAGLDLFGVA